jgi:hypothetical protein
MLFPYIPQADFQFFNLILKSLIMINQNVCLYLADERSTFNSESKIFIL